MMLFTPDFHFPLTSSAVKIQKENLKQFEIAHFSYYTVFELLENRTAFCDALLVRLWSHFELPVVRAGVNCRWRLWAEGNISIIGS